MKNNKLNLEELSVYSFVTELKGKESATVEGGATPTAATTIIGTPLSLIASVLVSAIIDVKRDQLELDAKIRSQAMGRNCPIPTIGSDNVTPTVTCTVTHVPNSICVGA